ncbi:SH3 domain-containing protein [Vibrio rotiferianus]|uniref:SH3 domain-containing protein n=1 Tax=Vibrio rotiferianus TaxID=190895 RepID=UPI00406A3FB6
MKYKVIKEYTDAPEDPIQVSEGEQLQFIEESDPNGDWANWVFCKGVGKEGWVPKQILTIEGCDVLVRKDYFAKEHTLSVGDELVEEYELNGWIWCEKVGELGEWGWAPLNHLSKG